MKKRKLPLYWLLIIIIAAFTVVLNLLALSTGFCDLYIARIYPFISDTLGHITAPLPFALGEVLMYAGALMVVLAAVFLVLLIFLRKKGGYRRFAKSYYKALLYTLVSLLCVYTVNWVVPFKSSLLDGREHGVKKYTAAQLTVLNSYCVENLNRLVDEVPREADGTLIIPSADEVDSAVFKAMAGLGDEFPRLTGYYPPVKVAMCTDILEWMGIGGYTYPYTMELTRNKYMSMLWYPVLIAHESAHHQGYYNENEANFLSYIGCTGSENSFVQYAGFIELYYIVNSELCTSVGNELDDIDAFSEFLDSLPKVDDRVWQDQAQAYTVSEEEYQADDHPLEEYADTATEIGDVGWETQDKILGENNYQGDILLILEYFDGKLY